MSAVFSLDQVRANTESATADYSTTSQRLTELLVRPGRVKIILNSLRWKKNQRTYHSYTTTDSGWRLSGETRGSISLVIGGVCVVIDNVEVGWDVGGGLGSKAE